MQPDTTTQAHRNGQQVANSVPLILRPASRLYLTMKLVLFVAILAFAALVAADMRSS